LITLQVPAPTTAGPAERGAVTTVADLARSARTVAARAFLGTTEATASLEASQFE
jgi:hypothetical protein